MLQSGEESNSEALRRGKMALNSVALLNCLCCEITWFCVRPTVDTELQILLEVSRGFGF